jgi:hypothetical protein
MEIDPDCTEVFALYLPCPPTSSNLQCPHAFTPHHGLAPGCGRRCCLNVRSDWLAFVCLSAFHRCSYYATLVVVAPQHESFVNWFKCMKQLICAMLLPGSCVRLQAQTQVISRCPYTSYAYACYVCMLLACIDVCSQGTSQVVHSLQWLCARRSRLSGAVPDPAFVREAMAITYWPVVQSTVLN